MDVEATNPGKPLRPDPDALGQLVDRLAKAAPVKSKLAEVNWNFSKCPTSQLPYCQMYEYGRSSRSQIASVERWQREGFVSTAAPVRDNYYLEAVKPMDFFRLFPEFPRTPWLALNAAEVKRRLKSLPNRTPVLVRSVPVETLLEDGDYKDTVQVLKAYQTTTIQPMEINWFFHDKELLVAFKLWLKENRPHPPKEKRGRTEPRVFLNALAAKRLLEVHNVAECEDITGNVLGKPLFQGDSNWYDAKAQAEKILDGQLPPIPIEKFTKNIKRLFDAGFTDDEVNQIWQHLVPLKVSEVRVILRPDGEEFVAAMRQLLEKLNDK